MSDRQTAPIAPDELDNILASPAIDFGDLDESTEGEVRGTMRRMATEMGDEKFAEFGIKFLLTFEPRLRRNLPKDNPAIVALDEYHALNG